MNLKKLPISHLSLIITDKNYDSFYRKCAEIELKKRIKNLGLTFDDLLQQEEQKIKKRGLNINAYLFSNNPTLQQLMELYFTNKYKNINPENNNLLFSEKHLCTNSSSIFFDTICNNEIKNLTEIINTCELSETEKDLLLSAKNALEERKRQQQEANKIIYPGLEILTSNEALQFLDQTNIIQLGNNLTEEQSYRITTSKLLTLKNKLLKELNEHIEDKDIYNILFGLKKVLEDSTKLNTQKQVLLAQSKNGYIIDYNTSTMKRALKK